MINHNLLPGMVCNSVEFFVVENMVKAIKGGKVIDFSEIPIGIIELLREEIYKDEAVIHALHEMQPDSEWKRLQQYVSCKFGGLDHQGDITEGLFQDGEYWDCPMRGKCAHEGVVCKLPIVNGHRLTPQQITLMQLSATEKTNEVIIDELNIAPGTFHKLKSILHSILGIQTKQGITKFCNLLNLI